MIVIDTHALVWAIEADPRLGPGGRRLIEDERAADRVGISAITVWEAAMLIDKQRLVLGKAVNDWFTHVLADPSFELLPLSPAVAIDAGLLPGDIHGDPADRLIIATARAHGCPVLTADRRILAYAAQGHLQAIDAGR